MPRRHDAAPLLALAVVVEQHQLPRGLKENFKRAICSFAFEGFPNDFVEMKYLKNIVVPFYRVSKINALEEMERN